ncbi:MAG: signal peptidase I [Patescibacteria group bacterium]
MLNIIKKYLDSRFYRILVGAYIVFIFIIIIFSVDIFSPFHSFTNKSDSMNPLIDRGSLTIVKSFSKYEIGEAIAYYAQIDGQEEIITHRITGIGGNVYTTKGDANEVADRELVKPRLVIGRVIFIIPYLGYLITFAKSLVGTWLSIIIPAIFIIAFELIRIIRELARTDQEKSH